MARQRPEGSDPESDGKLLKRVRETLGLTQEDMAKALRLKSRGAYVNYEKGRNATPPMIIREAVKMVPRSELTKPSFPVPISMVEIPLLAAVPASTWDEPEDVEDTIEVPWNFAGKGRFACRLKGDSLMPFLIPDDLLIFKRHDSPPIGTIILARAGRAVTVKQLKHDGQNYILHALNAKYEDPTADIWSAIALVIGVIRDVGGTEITMLNTNGLRPV